MRELYWHERGEEFQLVCIHFPAGVHLYAIADSLADPDLSLCGAVRIETILGKEL